MLEQLKHLTLSESLVCQKIYISIQCNLDKKFYVIWKKLLNCIIIDLIIYSIHICITHLHTKPGVASLFIEDLRLELIEILKTPNVELTGKVNNITYYDIIIKITISYLII